MKVRTVWMVACQPCRVYIERATKESAERAVQRHTITKFHTQNTTPVSYKMRRFN